MEINYVLNAEDYYKFNKEIAPTQKPHKTLVMIYAIMYVLFIFGDIIYAFLTGSLNNWNFSAVLLSIGVRTIITFLAILVFLGIAKLIASKKIKEVSELTTNGLFCEHRIILNEREMIELTDVNTSRYLWKGIGEIKEIENFVLINVVMSSTYIIPKRHFQDRAQIDKFLETAKQYKQNAESNFQLSHLIEYEKSLQ